MIYEAFEELYNTNEYPAYNSENYENERKEYRMLVLQVDKQFAIALALEYIKVDVPEAAINKVWDIAWSFGHSSGYSEVENYYMDLADILNLTAV